MANKNVVVVYDKLQSAVKKLEQYYSLLETQQKMISRLDTYFDHLYAVHGKKNTFTATMEDDIQSMSDAIKTDMADIDYLKNLTSYIVEAYTDAEGNTTTRSNDLLMTALGSIVPAGAGASATIYANMNDYSTAINQDSSLAADISQYKNGTEDLTKWVTYNDTKAETADAWDAVHENSSDSKESHAFKISETGTKISSKAENVVVKDMEKDVEEAQAKAKEAEEELKVKEEEMKKISESKAAAETKAQEAEARAKEAEAKAAEAEAKEAKTSSGSDNSSASSKPSQETTKPETNNNEQATETKPETNNNETNTTGNNDSLVDNSTVDNTSDNQSTDATIVDTEDVDSGTIIETDETEFEDLPEPTAKKSSSGSSKVIPIVAGLSAAGAAGVGAKIILDKKSNQEIEEDEEDEFVENSEDEDLITEEVVKNKSDDDKYLDSSDEFTYKTDVEPYEEDDLDDDNFGDVTEEEEVQGYQAIDFNDITGTH